MTQLTLAQAQKLLADTLAHCRANSFNPMAVVVLDADGAIRAAASEDNTTFMRWRVAYGKAYGAVAFGMPSRRTNNMAAERPHFVAALNGLADGNVVPVPGGVIIRDANKRILGAVGVSGDTSDNDEAAAIAAIEAAGLVADPG
jgi:uncharacterized protein GlcG (DUF336 family)